MANVPYFTKVFIVGILLFFSFYLMVGDSDFFFDDGPNYRFMPSTRDNETEEPDISEIDGDFVGSKEVEDFRHINLKMDPFEVSYITEHKSFIHEENVRIENGLLGSSSFGKVFTLTEDELRKLSSAILSGEISDTNLYGKVIVGLNDEEIFSGHLQPGEKFELEVNKSMLQSTNSLQVVCESSGWRLWAPTVYLIKQISLKSDFMGEVSQSFDFHVKEEETPVNLGRIILNFDEIRGDGSLIVAVNGETVFNETPKKIQWIDFEGFVKEGRNVVEMVSERETEFTVRDAKIIIFWDREAKEELEVDMKLSSSQYNRLPGEISFKIQKVFGTPTSLVATIEDPDGDEHSLVVQGILEEGKTIRMDLPEDYAGVGENKVRFSVTGSGGYTISDFDVDL